MGLAAPPVISGAAPTALWGPHFTEGEWGMRRLRTVLLFALALLPLAAGGCVPNPFSMGIFTPIPVPPWVADYVEERICIKSDFNTPILPPIPPGYRPLCEDPPDRQTIMRAMPRVFRGIPYFYEEFREDYDFTVERLVDRIDPPRFYPLVGPAQLHHCHYKCNVYYTETIESGYPFPFRCNRRRVETVYIDRDHLHLIACTPEQLLSLTRDLAETNP
jgi:hypothetical protein